MSARLSRAMVQGWRRLGPAFLPFADAATPGVVSMSPKVTPRSTTSRRSSSGGP